MIRTRQSLRPNRPLLMFYRSLFGLLGVAFYYAAIERLTLSDAVILNKLSPVFVLFFAYLFLEEKITSRQKVASILALLGAAFVVKPTLDLNVMPGVYGVLSALFAGAAYTVIRKLTAFDRPTLIVFYFCLFSSLVMIPFMILEGIVVPNAFEWLSLMGIGTTALVAQLFMTNAYQHAPASEISIYAYADTVFSVCLGLVLWREVPDVISLLGGILIVLAGSINYFASKGSKTHS